MSTSDDEASGRKHAQVILCDRMMAARIRAGRQTRDLTRESVALMVGITLDEFRAYEQGEGLIARSTLRRLGDVLHVSFAEWLGERDAQWAADRLLDIVRAITLLPPPLQDELDHFVDDLAERAATVSGSGRD
jgi:transcriptional regulator with XRE-family HTH domain